MNTDNEEQEKPIKNEVLSIQAEPSSQKTLFEQMQSSQQTRLKEEILKKFRTVFDQATKGHFKQDESRIAIKLFIQSHKADTVFAFEEYFKTCMAIQQNTASPDGVTPGLCLLQDLPDLLKILSPKLKSNDDCVLKVMRQSR